MTDKDTPAPKSSSVTLSRIKFKPRHPFINFNRSYEAEETGNGQVELAGPGDVELRMCPCGVKFHYTPGAFLCKPWYMPPVLPPILPLNPLPYRSPGVFCYIGRTVCYKNFSPKNRAKKQRYYFFVIFFPKNSISKSDLPK